MASDSRRYKSSHRDERDDYNNKRSRRRDDDYDDRNRRNDRDRDRDRYRIDDRDKHRSRDDRDKRRDRERSSKYDDRKYRGRSKSRDRYRKKRSRTRSNSVNKRDNRKYSNHGSRSPTFEKKTEIKKYSSSRSRSKTPPKKYEYIPKPSNNEVDAFKTLSKTNNEYYGSKYKVQPKYIEGDFDDDEKEKIHKEMQDRLKQHLASEGKVYPPPKPEPKETMYANDGSFLEMFKQMQDQHYSHTAEVIQQQPVVRPPAPQPMFGKRRGGKILKTGIVEKPKPIEELGADGSAKDAWSMYMHEVKKYKHTAMVQKIAMPTQELSTAPFDPRFPNQNQTRYCYQSYLDFHRCQKVRGEAYAPCQYFKKTFQSMCPNAWVEKWDGQRDEGTFPGKI